jgi:hypothetical protein
MKAGADPEPALRAMADRLRDALPRVPSSYAAGRAALERAIARVEHVSAAEAADLLVELEELGVVKYTTEGRGIGAAGVWTYPRKVTATS